MKIILLTTLLIISDFYFSQQKGEFNANFLYGHILSNELGGTSNNYEDYGTYSGVNLKCISNNGFQISYQRPILHSKWFVRAGYEKRQLTYGTTLFSGNYDPNSEFNVSKKLEVKNQYSKIIIGTGRRFSFFKSKLIWDIGIDLAYQSFNHNRVGYLDPIDPKALYNLKTGDFGYQLELNYSEYNYKINLSAQSSFKYFLTKNLGVNFYTCISDRISGAYTFTTATRCQSEIINGLQITGFGSSYNLGRVMTKYLTFGIGGFISF